MRTLRFSPVGFSAEVVGFSAGWLDLVRGWLDLVRTFFWEISADTDG